MESEVLDHVQNGDFVEFSKAIKQELSQRIHDHPYVKAKSGEVKKFDDAQNIYKELSASMTATDDNIS